MKLTSKGLLLGLGLLSSTLLFSCSGGSTSSGDTSSLNTVIADTWFSLGQSGEGKFDKAYTTLVYDPTQTEEEKPSSYYTIYAPSDLDASIRLTVTEISSANFSENATNTIKNLQTIAFLTTNQNTYMTNVYSKKDTLNNVTSVKADIQSTWNVTIDKFNVTSSSLENDKTNYLCVYYMPFYIRTYSDNQIVDAGFFAAPVAAAITSGSISKDADGKEVISLSDTTATSFLNNNKYITYTYDSSSDKIS